MTILLKSPLTCEPGHGRPALTFSEVRITELHFDYESKTISVTTQYGNMVDGQWVGARQDEIRPGRFYATAPRVKNAAKDAVSEYERLIASAKTAKTGSRVYDEVSRSLYQWLLDSGAYEGTIQ